MEVNFYSGQLWFHLSNTVGFEFDSFEGIGSVGAMVGRHGNVYTNGSDDFVRSWR